MLARALVADGHSVTVLTKTETQGAPDLEEGYTVIRSVNLLTCTKVAHRCDLVISKGGASLTAGLAAMATSKPLVIWHEMSDPISIDFRGPLRFLTSLIRRMLLRYAALHVAVTRSCAQSRKIPKGRPLQIIYNPVGPELIQAQDKARHKSDRQGGPHYDILFVGRLIREKGIFLLVDALRILESRGHRLTVCYAGEGPGAVELRRRLAELRSTKVDLSGSLSWPDLAQVYQRSRCLVLPSVEHPEGMGMVVVEAFAFGLPVIASDQPALLETMGDAGLAFRRGDSTGLANTLQALVVDPTLYASLSRKARLRAQVFSYPEYASRVRETIDSIPGLTRPRSKPT